MNELVYLNTALNEVNNRIYNRCDFQISDVSIESESMEYKACRFKLNDMEIYSRTAKITPKKVGQFVTFWKRIGTGSIAPFHETDAIDYFVVNVRTANQFGQFVFPKSVLIKKGILSTNVTEGKRAFRVYPLWDSAKNKTAKKTQEWQLNYFYEINDVIDFKKVKALYTLIRRKDLRCR